MTVFTLNTGAKIPAIGLGTWKSEPGQVGEAVKAAIEAGYRHIDGAYAYENEKEIGETLSKLFSSKTIKRSDLFYTSKLWNTFHDPKDVEKGLNETLNNLGLEYLDLYLMHWPVAFKPGTSEVVDVDYVETWKAMEKLVQTGKVKAIGVSNFDIPHLERLLSSTSIIPAVNQVELHPYLPQPSLLAFTKKHNILLTAYSPLGSGGSPSLLSDSTITEIAKKHAKDPGQVLVGWAVQRGTAVIPKSVNPKRIKSNLDIAVLDNEDLKRIESVTTRKRFVDPKSFWGVDVFDGFGEETK
ncbi:uncharacterized protein SPPG_03897 [Spizellomyces punctatus DAOM BR117]|uniref:NADP-dependent oxidoreductase domain-containing protein n=1 Tax=Spizellomyces punctatus (strain DAOM BR117) TaxID=645134 RepID=A0A0L0HIY0_SPIPD|nr:uncharacterized protein SPPG_03897 [Spizellomyces punctatus DAOM BR117]KND00784.1 hypothetical protein SPPG_03897 [Spizellomyces punctatus DAOM BR117]|eukprot:XP_016608823.1 hypothetical protein SPPG_03897 [Spizellomyces punctatus DAOM BR117]